MNRKIGTVAAIASLLFTGSALADPIVIGPGDCITSGPDQNCWTSDDPSQPNISDFETLLGESGLEELYKKEVDGGGEGGSFEDDYSTAFFNSPTDPMDALITWDGPDSIECPVCYLWVKDGRHEPSLYVFDISDWNGTDSIDLQDFWEGNGAISNIGILGRAGETKVSEPATLGLLGMSLMAVGFARRRRSAA